MSANSFVLAVEYDFTLSETGVLMASMPKPAEVQAPTLPADLEDAAVRVEKSLRRSRRRLKPLALTDPNREAFICRLACVIAAGWSVEPFVPTHVQKAILQVTDGCALRQSELEEVTGYDRAQLHRESGLKELMKLGKIKWHRRLGYYRPDRPPAEAKQWLGCH
jgi:hypothetical protein